MLNEKRNKNEIVNLYYGDNPRVLFPDAQLSSELEILGLNPNDYIYDLNSEQIRNIDSLYAELLLMESNALKQQVAYLKQTLYGSDAYDFMLSPPEHDKLGNPKNRDTLYYVKKIGKVKDGFENAKQGENLKEELNKKYVNKKYVNDKGIQQKIRMDIIKNKQINIIENRKKFNWNWKNDKRVIIVDSDSKHIKTNPVT